MSKKDTIYVASSWQNIELLDEVHAAFKKDGTFDAFDFRHTGRWWDELSEGPDPIENLYNPTRLKVFESDYAGIEKSSACLLVLPAGLDAHGEAFWMAGRGLPTVIWGAPRDNTYVMMSHLILAKSDGRLIRPGFPIESAISTLKSLLGKAHR